MKIAESYFHSETGLSLRRNVQRQQIFFHLCLHGYRCVGRFLYRTDLPQTGDSPSANSSGTKLVQGTPYSQAIKNAYNEEQKALVKAVGRQQLRSWGILIERDGKDYPSNAYAILTGCGGLHVATQCGVFKGTTKEVFVDRREYTGPLWEQIEEAFQFVLRNIHLGAAIVGVYRQDVYEIPPDAIRELIINAMVLAVIWIMVRYRLRYMTTD